MANYWKKHNPGCPCCACTGNAYFTITACCQPAPSATVTIKTGGGTTVGTGTTDAYGTCNINITGYTGTPLYITVSYQPTYYAGIDNAAGNTYLGNPCSRHYKFDLSPITYTVTGGTCNTVVCHARLCDDSTPVSGVVMQLQSGGGPWTNILGASCTTSAGGDCTISRTLNPVVTYRIQGTYSTTGEVVASAGFTTACAEDVRLRFNSTYPGGGTCSAPNYTDTVLSAGGSYSGQNVCCQDCWPDTIPDRLTLVDPSGPGWPGALPYYPAGVKEDASGAYYSFNSCVTLPFTCAPNTPSLSGIVSGIFGGGCNGSWIAQVHNYNGGSAGVGCEPVALYTMKCTGAGITLDVYQSHGCSDGSGHICGYWYPVSTCVGVYGGAQMKGQFGCYNGGYSGIASSTMTCNPFAATFVVPSYNIPCYGPVPFCGDPSVVANITIPSRTITIHA